jgi:CheY-like chemotaxis protein
VAEGELAAYAERASLTGRPTALTAEAAQPMALVLHELATNAVKHGALSHPEGRVSLTWDRASEDGELVLRWLETGGPPVLTPPECLGFGTKLIGDLIERQLGGRVEFDWQPAGLRVAISLPPKYVALSAGKAAEVGGLSEKPPGMAQRRGVRPTSSRPRVLVVEDETLLAHEAELTLSGLGYEVVGPVHSLIEALEVAAREIDELDAAVLDVNLGGNERSFPVAELLETRGIPCVFITGYDGVAALMGRDTRAIAVLTKPYATDSFIAAVQQALASRLETRFV